MTFETMLSTMASGMLKTGLIFVLTLIGSLPLGMIVALLRKSRFTVVRGFISGYISIMIEHNSFEYLLSRLGNYLAASKVETLALKAGDKNDMEESLNEEMACLYAITKTLTDIIEDIGNQRRSQVWQAQS